MRLTLGGLMLLGLALRIVAAAQPGFHHPDAIYQYLEPAYRLVTGQGVVTWEWRAGIRSWMLPALLAGPVALGEAIDGRSVLPLVLPRIAMALGSLGIIWAAWQHGQRHSPIAALLAGFVAATWFEFVYFGAQTLAEPLAASAFLVASVWITQPAPSGRATLAAAGGLLAAMTLLRPHYAPAGAVLVLVAWWPLRLTPALLAQRLLPFITGGLMVAAVAAAIDIAAGATPFVWIIENARQNIVEHVAARYGVSPPETFVAWLLALWTWWLVPMGIGLRFGWRRAPALIAASVMTIVLHSLIGHKEYRFIFLAVACLVIVAAIGWGELLGISRRRWARRRADIATVAAFVGWGLASVLLSQTSIAQFQRRIGITGSQFYAAMRADPQVCGVALVYGASFADVSGQVGLGRDVPQYMFWANDAARRGPKSWSMAARHQRAYNRIVGSIPRTGRPPTGYRTVECDADTDGYGLCLYARDGGCTPEPGSRFEMSRMLAAHGI